MLTEREKLPGGNQIQEIPQVPDIPKEVEARDGVAVVAHTPIDPVTDGGQQLTQTQANQAVSITIPSDQPTLTTQAKGNVVDALTWLAVFWLRMIKKAMHFGWRIVKKQP